MRRKRGVLLVVLVLILVAVGVVGYYATRNTGNTFLTSCSVTGVGGLELRVASDSTNASVSGETIKAVDNLGCNSQMQVVHLTDFPAAQGGWLVPVFPSQATPGGVLGFTITYQGRTYDFSAKFPPIGTSCVTLHVPSGAVTSKIVTNGQGSYCWE
jgi:hypothetical protein